MPLYSFCFCFSLGVLLLRNLPVNLAMTASAVHLRCTGPNMIAVHVDVAVYGKTYSENAVHGCMVPPVPACWFKMSTVVCEYMFHLQVLYKSTKIICITSKATKENWNEGVIVSVLSEMRGEITLDCAWFSTWLF